MDRVFEKGNSTLFSINRATHLLLLATVATINALVKFNYSALIYLLQWGLATLVVKLLTGLRLVSSAKFSSAVVSISALADSLVGRLGVSAPFIASASALVVLGIRGSPVRASLTYLLMSLSHLVSIGSYFQILATPLFLLGRRFLNRVVGDGALDALNGYLHAILRLGNSGPEPMLRALAGIEKRCVEVHVFRICGTPWALVVSNIHPGPFGKIGSGDLPSLILNEGRLMGLEIVFLHGYGSHELDIVDRGDAVVAARIVASEAARCSNCRSLVHVPTVDEHGSVRVVRFGLGGREISVVTRTSKAMDDIPSSVYKAVLSRVGDVILVDAQNVYNGVIDWDEEDVENLVSLLSRRLETCSDYVIGMSRREVEGCGVLTGGAVSIFLDACGRTLKLLVLDGNNIDERVYRDLRAHFHEVLTTDNHEETGIATGRGYRLVGEGEGCKEVVVSAALDALREAEAEAHKAPICYKRIRFCVRVLGERGFKKLQELASQSAKAATAVIAMYVAVPLTLQLLQFLF